jgi:tripartite-type tricarboxylate transporter receptor subunit TctC
MMGRTSRVIGAVFTLAVGLWAATAVAEIYPNRPVRIIVPTPPGGPVDAVARALAHVLAPPLGQAVIVDNRGGAGNTIGSKEAALADPDGYTLLFSSASGLVIAPMLHRQAGYDPFRSFEPIALVAESSNILVVNPSVPATSVQELVAYAKANPGKVNFSSGGIGVLPHLIGEMFKTRAGIEIVHVPYRGGGPSIADVLGGQVDMTFEGTSVLLPLIQAGKLRALAVTSRNRIPQLPDIPTMIEAGYPGFSSTSWTGLLAPAKTPPEITASLNQQVNAALGSPEFVAALSALSSQPVGGLPEELTNMIAADTDKWAPIVKSLHLEMD